MTTEETVKTLEKKNLALSNQLDKVTEDLFKAQEVATELKNKLDEKKHSEQLCAWAFDRVIEAVRVSEAKSTLKGLFQDAEDLLSWVKKTSGAKL